MSRLGADDGYIYMYSHAFKGTPTRGWFITQHQQTFPQIYPTLQIFGTFR